jgi:hypothetical protein
MPFKLPQTSQPCPIDPEALFRDLRRKTVPGLLSHQADLLRSYMEVHDQHPDIALQLPTGSGKTLVGLLIAEWRRRRYGERVVYLCPTRQLVNQVAEQAGTKYGIDLHSFTGPRADYNSAHVADWQSAEAVAVSTYSSLFNTRPFFSDPSLIILDDAHSAESYISQFWSLYIVRSHSEHQAAFSALLGLLLPCMPHADVTRLTSEKGGDDDHHWVEKLPTPAFQRLVPEIIPLLDEHSAGNDLRYQWSVLRDSLHGCHLYVSRRSILIRPLIPPSRTHLPFAQAKQRLYMSATLGSGGDLERVTGRHPIHKIPIPSGWDKQGIGRRFFLFPKRSLHDEDTTSFVKEAIKKGRRALYLVPDEVSAEKIRSLIATEVGCEVFDATQLESSKQPFIECQSAVAVVANRYDGIDLIEDDCRLMMADGLPGGANLQERFFVSRVTAQQLLDDRILTRLVQGFGRCTRSPNDYAAVVILGETLNSYLFRKERREFFHPEIQAELEFGIEQSKEVSVSDLIDNLNHFFARDAEWEGADQAILTLREGLTQKTLASSKDLADAVPAELAYQYALWNADLPQALEHCRTVLGKLNHEDHRGYRALWLYLAGSAAWLAHINGYLPDDEQVKDYYRKAQAAAPVLRWLVHLQTNVMPTVTTGLSQLDAATTAIVERLECVLEQIGTIHDRKFDAEENAILTTLLQTADGKSFELGHVRLGRLLGYEADNSDDDAAPDPWWIADDTVFVFEDHAEAGGNAVFSATKARQAASHPEWIRENLNLPPTTEIIPVVITPCTKTTTGAIPSLRKVRYWALDDFCAWVQNALRVIRDIRRTFPGVGDLEWRTQAAARLRDADITPQQLKDKLSTSCADAMRVGSLEEEVT